jgi:glycerol-3-phosphate dehydrogenase
MYDFAVIGAGAVGCSIARLLSRYKADICVLEKHDDVSKGASKANSGIIHGGYAAKYGTLKGKLNVLGNRVFENLDRELNFGYRKTGGMVLAFNEAELAVLRALQSNGHKNGVSDLRIIEHEEILRIEPNLNPEVTHALYTKDVGVISPYEYTIALAENGITNGVSLFLNHEVLGIARRENSFEVTTSKAAITTRNIINAAGVHTDTISKIAGINSFRIIPRKGQYILFQKGTGDAVKSVVFQVPTEKGKGILVTSTYHGNLMLGPNSEEVDDKEDTGTEDNVLEYVIETARKSLPHFELREKLKTFSGIRPTPDSGDFIIREEYPGFINVAGIESPGLTSSPAIAEMVLGIIKRRSPLEPKIDFTAHRPAIIRPNTYNDTEVARRVELLSGDERIVCRCERVTEFEIKEALSRNIKIGTKNGVKMRTRAGMGRCQGRFCGSRVDEFLKRSKR